MNRDLFRNIRKIQIQAGRAVDSILSGAYHSVFKGRGMEFEDVREYQIGDDIRLIDWNVTARSGNAYVKNFKEERELTVMLAIDVSSSLDFGSGKRSKRDLAIEIGALLAFSAIKNNDKVGLILFSNIVEKYLPPQKGVSHVLRIIRELFAFESRERGTDVGEALAFLCKVQKRYGICFIISDFIVPGYSKIFSLAAKRYDLISIYISDPREMEFPDMGLVSLRDRETGEEMLVDTSVLEAREKFTEDAKCRMESCRKFMKKISAGFIPVRMGDSYFSSIRRYFHLRGRRR